MLPALRCNIVVIAMSGFKSNPVLPEQLFHRYNKNLEVS